MAAEQGTAHLSGRDVATGHPVVVHVEGDRIARVDPSTVEDPKSLPWIGPGLVDLQVNGFAGIDLNDGAVSGDAVDRLARALLPLGVTTFLPTIITAAAAEIERTVRGIATALSRDPGLSKVAVGIHLEGPFISPEDGPRGAHPANHVIPPDWSLFDRWQRASGDRISIVTLSPEWPGATDFIARCCASGVIAAIGHTAASPEQIRAAVAAGARLSTHLGNGAHALLPRHPNYLWEQLAADDLWASVIADGFHLPDAVLKTVLRVKGDRAVLVSDAVALAGMPPGEYVSPVGSRVVLTDAGRLLLAADPRLLAGSARPLVAGVAHLVASGLLGLGHGWGMASTRPALLLGHPAAAGLSPGAPADLVLFRWDGHEIDINRVVKSGRSVFSSQPANQPGAA
ncbi:MAG: N-acetylglucosamine-6-phosphate deacetylase [uncultured Thermomicrobiales bacterium]|uniref:N-acetylglucosamine-6-phosphate deacetylase n=1 Tax=uncultured Thermomicrobiales bacterium TaxID=1645740 RepID=A0A6J4UTN0_9BACT|nr:MAG: N-acetylglucosamine-6-phosphate deacetylase [uncultured Thermomicrobiales bacterium]